jgi:predicted membrane-bound mannosyltransferase
LIVLLLAAVSACLLRFPDRETKIMHTDEATQAVKLHEMMEWNYHYDPVDHHGPTLLYSTIPLLWLSGTDWEETTESKLRLAPVLYGMALLLLLVLAGDGIGKMALAWGALFVAVSPLMVFYSRYYIMEVLLVAFTFGCIACWWRFFITRKTSWLAWAGICAGLMHATKETCVLHFAAMAVALLVVYVAEFFSAGAGLGVVNRNRKSPVTRRQLLVFLASAAGASILLFSQFFTEWRGVWDSVATYWNMIGRAGGQGHEKPFDYYFDLLRGGVISGRNLWENPDPESNWPRLLNWQEWKSVLCLEADARRAVLTEAVLILLALAGCIAAFTAKPARNQSNHLVRFLAVYGVVNFLIYSVIGYKTPWCIMGAWHALLIMAGLGAERLIRAAPGVWTQRILVSLIVLAAAHLALQSWRATRDFAGDSRNPYNYSMTSPDVLDWVGKIHRFAELHPDGRRLHIYQSDAGGGWPLPWYLSRNFPNYHWQGGEMDFDKAAVLLLSNASDEMVRTSLAGAGQTDVLERFAADRLTLHPTGSLLVYVKKDLWEQYVSRQRWETLAVQK